MSEEDAATCKSCIFRLRFGFRRAIYEQLFLTNEPLVAFVRKLGIKGDGDVARLLRVFLAVDIRGTHRLDIETFFEYFGIEFTEYNKRAFRLLAFGDQDTGRRRGSGKAAELSMVFDQFFVSMYNYGTLLHEALVRFAFDVMASGKETCNKQDVMELVSLLHADVGRVKETTATLMGIMDPHNRNKISFDTFRREERRLGSMLFPAFKLQKILRAKVLGQWFWRRATKKRRKARLIGADLCREYTKLKDEHLEKLKLAKGTGGGGEGASVGLGRGRGSVQVGLAQSNAADKQVEAGDGLNLGSRTPASGDDGYRPEGEDGAGSSSSSSSDSSDSDSNTRRSRRGSASAGGGQATATAAAAATAARRVSYAPGAPRGSASSGVETRVEPSARRMSTLNASGTVRRQSVKGTAPNDESSGRRRSTVVGPNGSGSSRRKPSLRPAVSPAGVSGRKGSMFEGMQMYAPSATPDVAAGRRRSSSKVSRVTPGNSSFTGSVSQSRYPPIEEGG